MFLGKYHCEGNLRIAYENIIEIADKGNKISELKDIKQISTII